MGWAPIAQVMGSLCAYGGEDRHDAGPGLVCPPRLSFLLSATPIAVPIITSTRHSDPRPPRAARKGINFTLSTQGGLYTFDISAPTARFHS